MKKVELIPKFIPAGNWSEIGDNTARAEDVLVALNLIGDKINELIEAVNKLNEGKK